MTTAAFPTDTAPDARHAAENSKKIRTLIVDDQLLQREVLRHMLNRERDIEIIGSSSNGREAVESIHHLNPDLVFLDVEMPELDGFGVVSELDPARRPAVIFLTSNEEFARKAFDVQALDYLIKPCAKDRLQVALCRARNQIFSAQNSNSRTEHFSKQPAPRTDRLAIKTEGRILLLRFCDVDWIESVESGVAIHADLQMHLTRDSLEQLEERLPSERFLRVNRSALVNIEKISEIAPILDGEYEIVLHNGTRLILTRPYRGQLQKLGV
ncbi:MAG TPA: response regulator [Verrucomicrobiae bacterium]|nr:response regulator [Verrucomicrobiae bacterium]